MTRPVSTTLLRRLWAQITQRRRWQVGGLLVLMVGASLAEVVSIGAVVPFLGVLTAPERIFAHPMAAPFIQTMGLSSPRELILPLTVAFCLAAVVSGAMRLVMLYVQTRLSYSIGADLSLGIYRRTLYQPYLVHATRNSSEIVSAITAKTVSVVHHTIMPLLNMLSSVLILAAILSILFVIDPQIALIAMAGVGSIYLVIILVTRRRLGRDGKRVSVEQNKVVKVMQEGLGGIRDVLIDGAQEAYARVFRNADVPMRRAQANIQIIAGSPRFGIEALGMVFIAIMAYSLATRPEGLLTSISALGALALGAQRMLPILQMCFASWSSVRGGQAALADVLHLLDQPLPSITALPPPSPLPFEREIRLRDVSFRYAPDAPWVLRNLDLSIRKGSRIGFIGTTGSGKSTLLDIVMGLLSPIEGALEIDGTPVMTENHRAWQVQLAHVPQSIFLNDGTIAENIAFGTTREAIDMDRVRQAANEAQIADTIESWEDDYETVVGERGVRLSGGQRQRIGIARALYKRAGVVVLDEATSALDAATEEVVMQSIENLEDRVTVLVVAHRLTTLRKCDQVVELRDGKIYRVGTYREIVEMAS